jgi:SAM-dependent methyltransferase
MRGISAKSGESGTCPSTPSHLYDEQYFLTDCEGYENFEPGTAVQAGSSRIAAVLRLVRFNPGERILDVGCGRGEAVRDCARGRAVAYGVDYSADALQIVRRSLVAESVETSERIHLSRADAKRLPFPEASIDKLLMLDLVEHLYPWELAESLREAWRVLVVGGQLIIHTAPNLWYYRFGYPLYRLFERLRGKRLPPDPRSRFPFHHLHVNEQSVPALRRSLRRAGFAPRVWLDNIQPPLPGERSLALRLLLKVLLGVCPFRWVFRNDILAIAHKR